MATYTPNDVSAIFGVAMTDWNKITFTTEGDETTAAKTTTGNVHFTQNENSLAVATITMNQASPDHGILSAYKLAKQQIPITIVDNSGSSIHFVPVAAIKKAPGAMYGPESEELEWSFHGKIATDFLGGNN